MGRQLAATRIPGRLGRSVVAFAMLAVCFTADALAQYQFRQPYGCKTGLRPGAAPYGLPFGSASDRQTLYQSEYYRRQIGGALDSTYDRLSQSQKRLREAESDADYAAQSWLSADERAFHAEVSSTDAAGRLEAATKQLRATETAILAAQRDDSPYGRARAAVRRTAIELKTAEQRLLASSEYRRRRAAVDAGSARPIELLQLRRSLLEGDAAYRRIKARLAQRKQQLDDARAKQFQSSLAWQAATEQMAQARQAKSTSRLSLTRSRRDRTRAEADLRRSQDSAAAEQQTIARESRRATSLGLADQEHAALQRRILSGR